MTLDVRDPLPLRGKVLIALNEFEYTHMATQTEVAATLQQSAARLEALNLKLAKVATEVATLKGIADPAVAAAVTRIQAALAGSEAAAQKVDDIVPDAPAAGG